MVNIKNFYKAFSNLSKRERLVLYVTMGIICLTILDRLILSPVLWKMKTLDEQIQNERTRIKRDIHIIAQKDRIIEQSNKYAEYSTKDLSTEEITTSFLKEIGNLANETSVYLIDIKPAGTKKEDVYRKYFVDISCEGQMEQIINFMYSIENSNNLLKIEKYNINPKTEESSIARCSISVSKAAIP